MNKSNKDQSTGKMLSIIRDRQFFAFLILLFYPFNNTIIGQMPLGMILPYILMAIGVLLLIPDTRRGVTKNTILWYGVIIVLGLLLLLNNKIIGTTLYNVSVFCLQIMYVFLIPFLISINVKVNSLLKALSIYCIEHVIGTAIPLFLPNFYESMVLDFICAGRNYCFARTGFRGGLNAGLTSHYSTNGCYLSISSLLFAFLYFTKKKRGFLLLLLLSIVALLIIGKRAHLVFSIISILVCYFLKDMSKMKENAVKKITKLLTVIIAICACFMITSSQFPIINTTLNRIIDGAESGDATNGRMPLYSLAIEKWHESPIFGNGWGGYIRASHDRFGLRTYHMDYIHSHNDYLELLCDCGIVGLVLYVTIILSFSGALLGRRLRGKIDLLAISFLIFYILYGFTGTPLYIPCLYVLLIMFLAILRKEKENEKSRRNDI